MIAGETFLGGGEVGSAGGVPTQLSKKRKSKNQRGRDTGGPPYNGSRQGNSGTMPTTLEGGMGVSRGGNGVEGRGMGDGEWRWCLKVAYVVVRREAAHEGGGGKEVTGNGKENVGWRGGRGQVRGVQGGARGANDDGGGGERHGGSGTCVGRGGGGIWEGRGRN